MADPIWTYSYDVSRTPEQNALTRVITRNPIVTLIKDGATISRGIQINSTAGDVVFITNNVPNLRLDFGVTAEVTFALSAAGNPNGNCGVQVGFADRVVLLDVFPDRIMVEMGNESPVTVPTGNNTIDTVWRILVATDSVATVFRNGILVAGPITLPTVFSRQPATFMFWCESGAIGTIKAVKFFVGGAVAPAIV